MSEDLPANRWWLASDGKWYPPELHPDVHGAAPGEQDRNAALLNATIGVARVRERVFADVRRDRRAEHFPPPPADGATGSAVAAHTPDRETTVRPGREPLPRYREALAWAGDTKDTSLPAGKRPPPRWAPSTRDPVSKPTSPRSGAEDERTTGVVPAVAGQGARTPSSAPSPPPRWGARTSSERTWPPPRVATPPPPPSSSPASSPLPDEAPADSPDTQLRAPAAPPFFAHEMREGVPAAAVSSLPSLTPTAGVETRPAPHQSTPVNGEGAVAAEEPVGTRGLDDVIEAALAPADSPLRQASPPETAPAPALEEVAVETEAVAASPTALAPTEGASQDNAAALAPGAQQPTEKATRAETASSFGQDDAELVEESASAALIGDRVVPPSGRRRPRIRSASLRDAVADAVARAAAQGPLTPRGPEDEGGPAATSPSQEPSALWPAGQGTQSTVEGSLAAGEPPVYGPAYPAELIDPYEAFAVLASQHAMGTDATSFEDEDLEDSRLAAVADVPAEPEAPAGAATAESELAPEAGVASPQSAEATGDATGSSAAATFVPEDSLLEDLFLDDGGVAISVPRDSSLDVLLENVAADESETGDLETGDLETGDLETGEAVAAELVVTAELTAELTVELTAETVGEEVSAAEGGSDRVPAGQELAGGEPAHDEGEGPAAESERTSDVETQVADETPFPFGERRSAARQARKPLPAALQEAVAAGAAQDRGAMASQPTSASGPHTAKRSKKDPKADAAASNDPQDAKKPGVIRRYGSAIAIVVLFLAAGGVAAGVAAFHGPVTPPAPPTKAQDRAAAGGAVLGPEQVPASWHLNRVANAAASYGLGSPLVTASLVRAWVAGEQACSADLRAVAAAMTPTVGSVTAVAYSQASTRTPLGASWDIADAVAFHTNSAEVASDLYRMQSVLSKARARDCVARFWSASLQDKMPGYLVMMTVAPRAMPQLPGKPLGWEMEMQGTATNATSSIPLRFEITSFAAGRAEAYLAVSSDGAALPALTATRALFDLAARVNHAATTDT